MRSIPPSELIARELEAQGTSLESWCADRGTDTHEVRALLNAARLDHEVIAELAAEIGVSPESFGRAQAA